MTNLYIVQEKMFGDYGNGEVYGIFLNEREATEFRDEQQYESEVQPAKLSGATIVTEHGTKYSGGSVLVRPSGAEVEAIYPVEQWIADTKHNGSHVLTRKIIVMSEWTELK
jgi:hypothetical protein